MNLLLSQRLSSRIWALILGVWLLLLSFFLLDPLVLLLADVDHDGVPAKSVDALVADPDAAGQRVLGGHQHEDQHQEDTGKAKDQTLSLIHI